MIQFPTNIYIAPTRSKICCDSLMGYRKSKAAQGRRSRRSQESQGKWDTANWGEGEVLTVSGRPSLVPPHPQLLNPPTLGAGPLLFVTPPVIPHSVLSLLLD